MRDTHVLYVILHLNYYTLFLVECVHASSQNTFAFITAVFVQSCPAPKLHVCFRLTDIATM